MNMVSNPSRPRSLSSSQPSTSSVLLDDKTETLDCATQMMADEFGGSSPLSSIEGIPDLPEKFGVAEKRNIASLQTPDPEHSPETNHAPSSQRPALEPSPSTQMDARSKADLPTSSIPTKISDLITLNGPERYTAGQPQIDCDYLRDEDQGVFVLKPTLEQWDEFPALLAFAVSKGALNDGCFKMVAPKGLHGPVPDTPAGILKGHGYMPQKLKNGFWRVYTVPTEATFSQHERPANTTESPRQALARLKKLFGPGKRKRLAKVAYRADVPAWTPELRRRAGVPEKSTMYPLKGDMLDQTKVKIPGIHTPYVYQSAAAFGATFQLHDEDYKLISLNHLYIGRKIWLVNPSTAILDVERACDRGNKCAQFMRHRAEFIFPDKFAKLGVPCRIVDQRPGETMVILPDAYHQGFSTGYTLAEAKNYADAGWSIGRYQPCGEECNLNEAIPADMMAWLEEGEKVQDLCAQYELLDKELPEEDENVAKQDVQDTESRDNGAEEEESHHEGGDESIATAHKAVRASPPSETKRKRKVEDDFDDAFHEATRIRQTRSRNEF